MGLVALLPEDSSLLELLPHNEWMHELQAPIHEVSVSPRTRLFWSSSSYQHNRINECATKAAGQTIKGDALLVSDVSHIRDLDHLLHARRPTRRCQSRHPPSSPSWPLNPWSPPSCQHTLTYVPNPPLPRQALPSTPPSSPPSSLASSTPSSPHSSPPSPSPSSPPSPSPSSPPSPSPSSPPSPSPSSPPSPSPPSPAASPSAAAGPLQHHARPPTDRHTACKPAILTPPSHLLSTTPDLPTKPAELPIPISLQPPRGPGHLRPEAPPPDHGCRPGSSCAGPSCPPRWQDLPAGLVGEVGLALLSLGGGARDVIALSHVSKGTRQAVLADSLLLAATPFTLDLRQPLRPCTSAAAPQATAAAGAPAGRRAAAAGGPQAAAAAAAGAACVPGPGGLGLAAAAAAAAGGSGGGDAGVGKGPRPARPLLRRMLPWGPLGGGGEGLGGEEEGELERQGCGRGRVEGWRGRGEEGRGRAGGPGRLSPALPASGTKVQPQLVAGAEQGAGQIAGSQFAETQGMSAGVGAGVGVQAEVPAATSSSEDGGAGSATHHRQRQRRQPLPGQSVTPQQLKQELSSLPAVLLSAAKHGNGSALGVHAQLLEASGQAESALRVWRRCAKAGDVEGQLRLGCACYQGAAGCVSDSEAAQQWLSKGVRGLLGISSLSHFSVDITAQTVTLAYPDVASPAEPQPGPADPGAAPDGPGARPRAWVQASRRQQQAGREGPSSPPGHPGAAAAMSRTSVVVPFHQLWQLREQQQQQQQQAGGSSRSKPQQHHHQLSRQKEVGEVKGGLVSWVRGGGQGQAHLRGLGAGAATHVPSFPSRKVALADVQYTGEADTLNHVLASAAIILGFMHFDGDGGMRVDQALACNLFKLAALAGSREAAQVLGWMFSTGQYGGSSM